MSSELQVTGLVGNLPNGGRVYRCADPSMLVKVVDEAATGRLAAEAEWRALGQHPMLGQDPGLATSQGAPALCWRGAAGVPLGDALTALGPLPPRVALAITAEVGALFTALTGSDAAASPLQRGLLAPQDLALSPDGQLSLLDPGSGPRAPDAGDPRAQTWRLGALLFALLTGGAPPRPGKLASAYDRTLRRAMDPSLDPALSELLRDLLCAEPSHRPVPEEAQQRVAARLAATEGPDLVSWAMERLFEVPPPAEAEPAEAEPAEAEPAEPEPAPDLAAEAEIPPPAPSAGQTVAGLEPGSEELLFQPPDDLLGAEDPAPDLADATTLRDGDLPSLEELLFEPPPELMADAPTAVAEDDDETELDTRGLGEDSRTSEVTDALGIDAATAELLEGVAEADTPPPPLFARDQEQADVSRSEDATDPDGLILARKLAFDEDTEPVAPVDEAGLMSEDAPAPTPAPPPPPRRAGTSPAVWVGIAVLLVIVVVILARVAQAG